MIEGIPERIPTAEELKQLKREALDGGNTQQWLMYKRLKTIRRQYLAEKYRPWILAVTVIGFLAAIAFFIFTLYQMYQIIFLDKTPSFLDFILILILLWFIVAYLKGGK